MHRWTNRNPQTEAETFPAKTAQTSIRWLEENYQAHPFFLWVDCFDPHEPWDAPEYLVRRYNPDYEGTPMIHPNYWPSNVYSPAKLKKRIFLDLQVKFLYFRAFKLTSNIS